MARIDALLDRARAEIATGRRARALDYLWDAYRMSPADSGLRANVLRAELDGQLARGEEALRRGDISAIPRLQRRNASIQPLFAGGLPAVADEADLILQWRQIDSIIADLRQAERDRRRREILERLENPADALAGQRLRENALGPLQLTWLWATGGTPRAYVFGPGHRITQDLRESPHAALARYLLYQKHGRRPRNGDSYTNYRATFGLRGLFTSRTLSEQFVGSFRIDAEVINGRVRYTATNTTSFRSFLYSSGPDWEHRTLRPMSNMRQTYVWWEPLHRWP